MQNFPGFIEKNVNKISWKDVSDGLGYCYGRSKIYCSWNWEYDHIPRIYVVGDSHMSVLEKDIVDYAINNKHVRKMALMKPYVENKNDYFQCKPIPKDKNI